MKSAELKQLISQLRRMNNFENLLCTVREIIVIILVFIITYTREKSLYEITST